MAVDMFIKLDGIDGESKDDAHGGEIDLIGYTWGMSQSGTFHSGGGGGAGKVNVQNLTFTHAVDLASPILMLYCSNGDHIAEATVTVRKAGKDPLEYLTIKMTKVMVTSVQQGGSPGDENLIETVDLNFAQAELTYVSQGDDGAADTEKEYGWDIEKNKQL